MTPLEAPLSVETRPLVPSLTDGTAPARSELLSMESNGDSYAALGNHLNMTEQEAKQACAVERDKVRRY